MLIFRSFLGISIRYQHNNGPVTRFIAIKRLLSSHTGSLATKLVKEALDNFEISMDDVISITTDNGANLLKAIRICQLFQSHLVDDFLDMDLPFTAQAEAYDNFIDKELKKHAKTISDDKTEKYCFGIRCAAHTLNLAFEDAIKECKSDKETIDFARELVKKLRTEKFLNFIHLKNLPKPQIDVPTRWYSAHTMLQSLLKLKPFVEELAMANDHFATTEEFWGQIVDITEIFNYVKITMKSFESENLVLSDVYKHVTSLKLQLKQFPFLDLARKISKQLQDRFDFILKATPTLACMYLDPRFQCALDEDEKSAAKSYLMKLYERINSKRLANNCECEETEEILSEEPEIGNSEHLNSHDENDNLLEQLLQSKCTQNPNTHTKNISLLLDEFDYQTKRISSGMDILDFWKNSVNTRPELSKLAAVIFSIPPAEVICERHFSTLSFVFNKLRNRLSDESLQRIMFIKLNHELF